MPNPYDHSGLNHSCYRGRAAQLRKVIGSLKKDTPDQVSIVGPRYFGKSVLLTRLVEALSLPGSPFDVVLLWDLKAYTPTTNAEFFSAMARKLDSGMSALGFKQYSEYLQPAATGMGENIREVVQDFGQQGRKILLVLDGFDHLAREPQISRSLWDYLRALAQDEYLSYVIASRRGLREAIPDREGRNSEFWNIFATTEVIRPVEGTDLPEWLAPLFERGFALDESARKELLNWTGGAPVLLSRVCSVLWNEPQARKLSKADIDSVCETVARDQWTQDHLMQLWDDCSQEMQGDLLDLAVNHLAVGSLSPPRQKALIAQGYLLADSPTPRPSCRFIWNFAGSQSIRSRDLRDLMKDEITALQTVRSLLQLRISSIPKAELSFDLRSDIEHAIEGLGRGPRTALIAFRSIADEATSIAWAAEFPDDQLPASVQQYLTLSWDNGGAGFKPDSFDKLGDKNVRRRILNAVAGNQPRRGPAQRISTKVSRPLMVLIDHLTEVGNFGQHIKDIAADQEAPVDIGFCIAACWSATELLQRIGSDLR